jgi:alpha-ketoglutarate-dependent 2,4-dichlorophenoxyacetate dioxygenase
MSLIEFKPLHDEFGARVTGVDLSAPLTDEDVAAIRAAMDEYSVLCFPDQQMTDDAHLAFTKNLGEPEPNHVIFGATGEVNYFGTIGNVIDADNKKGNSDPHTRYQSGNNLWHSDSSFRLVPTKFSINHAYEVPGEGGITEFASQRLAYEHLPAEMQGTIDSLHVLHDYVFSRSQVAPVDPNHAASLPPIEHKLVRTNPSNGRKSYYVGSHARSIIGLSGIESRQLIDDLLESATKPESVYAHQWQVGDTVIWDNRCLMHRGLGYDADRWRRLMRQTRVSGDGPTLNE